MGIGLVGCHQYSTLLIGIILFFMCVLRVTLWCILTIMGQFSEYKTLASLFLRFSLKICLGSWDRDNFLVICNFFIFQKKMNFHEKFHSKLIKNGQKSIFNFWHIPKKWKIEFEITKNGIEFFEIIKNWIFNFFRYPKN